MMFVPDVISCITSFSDFPAMRNMMAVNQNWKTGVDGFCQYVTKFEVTYPDDETFMMLYRLGWNGAWNHFPDPRTIFTTQWQYFFMFSNLESLCFRNLTEEKYQHIEKILQIYTNRVKATEAYKKLIKTILPLDEKSIIVFGRKFPLLPNLLELENLSLDVNSSITGLMMLIFYCPNIKKLVGGLICDYFTLNNLEYFVGFSNKDKYNHKTLCQNPNFKKSIIFCIGDYSEACLKTAPQGFEHTLCLISEKDDSALVALLEEEVTDKSFVHEYAFMCNSVLKNISLMEKCMEVYKKNNSLFCIFQYWIFYQNELTSDEQELLLLKISLYINNAKAQFELAELYEKKGGCEKEAKHWFETAARNGCNPISRRLKETFNETTEAAKTNFDKAKRWLLRKLR